MSGYRKARNLDFDWGKYFYYDETSPTGLRWKVPRFGGEGSRIRKPGDVAGTMRSDGYINMGIQINHVRYRTLGHRVIWFLAHGSLPPEDMEIDHIDGDRRNNKLENLRAVQPAINLRNRAQSCRAKKRANAPMGVYRTDKTNILASGEPATYNYWVAGWVTEDGIRKQTRFSVEKMGEEAAYKAALEFREKMMGEMKEKLGYSDRHGEVAA